jgi:general secretion pathway protein J
MKARGFTLVELLVAITILAIVAVLGWRGLDSIIRARAALTAQMETTRGMQLAFAQLQSDAEHLLRDPEFARTRPFLVADATRLVMVRQVFNENEPSRLQVVSYRIEKGTLVRRESLGTRDYAQLDVLWQAAIGDNDPNPAVPLQSGVTAMTVQLFLGGYWIVPPAPASGLSGQKTSPGLQVALKVAGMENPMTKVFLLGGV